MRTDQVREIARRLGVSADRLSDYFVQWEGEQFPLLVFAQVNERTPQVLEGLLSHPIGTPIRLTVNDLESAPFWLVVREESKNRKAQEKITINDQYYYTVEAFYKGGSFLGKVEHVLGKDVLRAKRSLSASANEGEPVRYTVIAEGAQPRVVSQYHVKRRLL